MGPTKERNLTVGGTDETSQLGACPRIPQGNRANGTGT